MLLQLLFYVCKCLSAYVHKYLVPRSKGDIRSSRTGDKDSCKLSSGCWGLNFHKSNQHSELLSISQSLQLFIIAAVVIVNY